MLEKTTASLRRWGRSFASAYRTLASRHSSLAVAAQAVRNFREHQMRLACAYFSYHSFIAVFALILLASAVLGFILKSYPGLQQRLISSIYDILPDFGGSLDDIINAVVKSRSLVGVIGVVGLLWTGSRISTSLETGFRIIQDAGRRPFWKRRLLALCVIAAILSVGAVTVGLEILYTDIISWVGGGEGIFWTLLARIVGIVIFTGLTFAVFALLFWAVPGERARPRDVTKAALLAAVAFHLTRIGFSFYFSSISKTRLLYGTIGVVIGILIWLYLIGAVIFFCGEVLEVLRRRESPSP